jgi:hypothetical protein
MTGTTEHLRPEEVGAIPPEEFARTAGLPMAQVRELVDYGLLAPDKMDLPTALALREAVRLKQDFDLDVFGTGLLAGYIVKIHQLQAEVDRLRAQGPARTVVTEVSFTSVRLHHAPARG